MILYGNEASGHNRFDKCDRIQYRGMRFFLGVHIYIPIHGLQRVSTSDDILKQSYEYEQ